MKLYFAAAGAAILATLVGIYKYRGFKVDQLENEVDSLGNQIKVADRVNTANQKKSDYEADNRVAAAKAEARDVEDITDTFYSV